MRQMGWDNQPKGTCKGAWDVMGILGTIEVAGGAVCKAIRA